MDLAKKSNRYRVLVAIVVTLLVVFGAYKIGARHSDQNTPSSSATSQGVSIDPSGIKYPAGWQEATQITQADKDNGVVSEAAQVNPEAHVVVRVLNGPLDKSFDIKTLPDQTAAKLKGSFVGFSLVSKDIVKMGQHDAAKVTYKKGTGSSINETSIIIVPTSKKTFYITFVAKPDNFAKITTDIATIQAAAADYIDSHLGT